MFGLRLYGMPDRGIGVEGITSMGRSMWLQTSELKMEGRGVDLWEHGRRNWNVKRGYEKCSAGRARSRKRVRWPDLIDARRDRALLPQDRD